MNVLERERARDAQLQVQVDYSGIYPYTRSFCIPRLKTLPKLNGFWKQRGPATTSEFCREKTEGPARVQTTVHGGFTQTHLWFGFVCHEPRVDRIRALFHRPPITRDDHVRLDLDTAHDHRSLVGFLVNPLGIKQNVRGSVGRGNRYWENKAAIQDVVMDWDAGAAILDEKWVATMAIPFETLHMAAPPADGAWGINFSRYQVPQELSVSSWNATFRAGTTPWAYGDLYFGQPPVVMERVSFGELMGSGGEATVWMRSQSKRPAKVTVLMDTFADNGLTHYGKSKSQAVVAPAEGTRVSFPYRLDVDSWADVRIKLQILDDRKRVLHRGWYLFGYENGQKLMVRFPRKANAANPKPGEKDFMDKKRRYVINRLPEFKRVTTAQGAPSDFTLRSMDGKVIFNLMEAGVLAKTARFIHGLFDDENDRLLGANFFIHQPAGMVYSNLETQLVHQLTPLSILRFGSAQCCCHAAVLMGILEKMEIHDTGRFYACHRIGLEGHVITAVDLKGRLVLLDPSVGRFWYLWDDKTLATAADITKDIALADRAGKHLRRYFDGSTARFAYYDCGAGVWPTGAPAE